MKVLVVDDERPIRETLDMFLQEKGYEVLTAESGERGLEVARAERPDIVLLDVRLPGMDGLEVLRQIAASSPSTSVIMITAHHDMDIAIRAVKLGAYECIHKPLDVEELDVCLRKVAENLRLADRLENLLTEISHEYRVDNIVGMTKAMQDIFKIIGLASENRATVLIQGESGTGKELIAKAIHYNSAFKKEPFVPINISALVETLLESELFGHEKGAFTGASHLKKGKIELAQQGTIFLDEIGELSPLLQVKLLRFLQEREFERVGGEKTLRSNTRVIAATNRNLATLVAEGRFREDLYFRLKVVEINVPPLRERRADIPLLIEHLLNKINRDLHKSITKIPNAVMESLVRYSWPGNIRELENVLTRAAVLSKGEILLPEYLPDFSVPCRPGGTEDLDAIKPLEQVKMEHVRAVLQCVHWDRGKACQALKVSRPTLRKMIKDYHLQP